MSKITFTERAFAEYLYWQSQDKKTLKRINACSRIFRAARMKALENRKG